VRDILKRYGIGIKDVRLVQTGLQPERVAALRQGLVVASILNRPSNLVLEQEGFKRLLDIEDLKIPAGVRCLITTRKLLKARPALADNFTMAWLESLRFILTQKRETKQIIGKYTQNADDVQLEEAWHSLSTQTEIPPYDFGHSVAGPGEYARGRSARLEPLRCKIDGRQQRTQEAGRFRLDKETVWSVISKGLQWIQRNGAS
jgi:hypothetical protein